MMVFPKSIWFTRHIRKAWTVYIAATGADAALPNST